MRAARKARRVQGSLRGANLVAAFRVGADLTSAPAIPRLGFEGRFPALNRVSPQRTPSTIREIPDTADRNFNRLHSLGVTE